MSCLQTLTSRKIYLCFSHLLLVLFDLEIHCNINFHQFVIPLWQGDRIVPGFFIKQDSSFHLVAWNNCTVKFYFLCRYRAVARKLTKVALFEVDLSGVW